MEEKKNVIFFDNYNHSLVYPNVAPFTINGILNNEPITLNCWWVAKNILEVEIKNSHYQAEHVFKNNALDEIRLHKLLKASVMNIFDDENKSCSFKISHRVF